MKDNFYYCDICDCHLYISEGVVIHLNIPHPESKEY